MSLFRTVDPADASVYEGAASLGSIAEAARETALFADNYNAAEHARTEAFDEARTAIREATGIELDNPQLLEPVSIPSPASAFDPVFDSALGREDPFKIWDNRIQEIMEQHPDKADMLSPFRLEGINKSALGKARASNERYELLSSTREDWPGFFAGLGGGFAGALQDPVTLATLPFGFGAGAARSVGGKILATTWREALISGVTEAAVQPTIQKWRAEAGLPAGLEEGLKNVGLATALGGVLGGAVRGVVEAPGAVRRRFSRRPDPVLTPPSVEKIADDLSPVRDQLPPATRAAVDVFDQDRAVMQAVREEFGERVDAEFAFAMDETNLFAERIGNASPEPIYRPRPGPQRSVRRPQSLTEFLAQRGLKDEGGELAAMDLDKLSIPASGKLVRKNGGVSLDQAREAAAEAGYIHGYGSRDGAVANSTVDDLLTALREEQGGRRVFALGDEDQALQWRREGEVIEEHKNAEAVRREIFEASSGRLTPDESSRAQRLVDGGMDVDEAVERVILYDDTSALEASPDPFDVGSAEFDAQLAALENQIDPEDMLDDLLFVADDGSVSSSGRTVGEALEEADRGLHLSDLVEACKPS